ncbi:ATPase, V0 complex, subunit E [Imleria badia]|nr:ATPase, V0 complex, subunit E [Imleria badia]
MASMFPIVFILVIVLGLMACGYLFVPKGPQQTTIRTSIMLTLACCYLMWMITYMAQLHPLIVPIKSALEI